MKVNILTNNTKFENCLFSGNINANSASSFADVNNISGDPLFQDTSTLLNNIMISLRLKTKPIKVNLSQYLIQKLKD